MDEIRDKSFQCPYCFSAISITLDLSVQGEQSYTEDCEVCCNPIAITFSGQEGKIRGFRTEKELE